MTVTNQTFTSPLYYGNNITTTFPTAFQFTLPEDLRVDVSNLDSTGLYTMVYGSDYTLLGMGDPSGGTVVTTVPLPSTKKLRVVRNTPYTQNTHYVEGTDFPAHTHEDALDRLTYIAQTLQAKLDRAPQLATTSANFPQAFPDGGMANRGKLIRWDANTGSILQAVSPAELTFVGAEIAGEDVNIKDMGELNPPDTLDYTIVYDVSADINKKVKLANLPYGGEGAPTGLTYVTVTNETALPNERKLTAGTNISITDGGPGGDITISALTPPITSSYILAGHDSGLSNDRVLTVGTGLQISDFGPKGNYQISPDPPSRTDITSDNDTKPMTAKRMLYHESTALGWAAFSGVASPPVGGTNAYNITSITRIENSVSSLPFYVGYEITLTNVGFNDVAGKVIVCSPGSQWWTASTGSTLDDGRFTARVRFKNNDFEFEDAPAGINSVVVFGNPYQNY